jgi:hypothetical protein
MATRNAASPPKKTDRFAIASRAVGQTEYVDLADFPDGEFGIS